MSNWCDCIRVKLLLCTRVVLFLHPLSNLVMLGMLNKHCMGALSEGEGCSPCKRELITVWDTKTQRGTFREPVGRSLMLFPSTENTWLQHLAIPKTCLICCLMNLDHFN